MPTRVPTHLTNSQLIDAVAGCARGEREATALLVAHLAEMDARRLHLGAGFSSLFAYCREVLKLSESATCKRIEVARTARRYPVILDRLEKGSLSLTTARLIGHHLTDENHHELIAAAAGLGQRAVEELLARRFPRPDVAPFVRRLPAPAPPTTVIEGTRPTSGASATTDAPPSISPVPVAPPPQPQRPPAIPLSGDRYEIRFTARAATWEKLRIARDLLRHAVPSGDPAEILDRALTALIEDLARKKCAIVAKPAATGRATDAGSRHIPAKVRREVWARDQGLCAFVSNSGRRCGERGRLEFHHVEPYAMGGAATLTNIQLRCRAHNVYEAMLVYGSQAHDTSSAVQDRGAALSAWRSTGRAAGSRSTPRDAGAAHSERPGV